MISELIAILFLTPRHARRRTSFVVRRRSESAWLKDTDRAGLAWAGMGWIPFRDSFIQIIHDQTTTKERKKKKIWHFYQSRKRIESNLCRTPKRNEKENLLALGSSVVVFDEFEMIRRKRTMELGQERRRENETKGIS